MYGQYSLQATLEWKAILTDFYSTLKIPAQSDLTCIIKRVLTDMSDQLEIRLKDYEGTKAIKKYLRNRPATVALGKHRPGTMQQLKSTSSWL